MMYLIACSILKARNDRTPLVRNLSGQGLDIEDCAANLKELVKRVR